MKKLIVFYICTFALVDSFTIGLKLGSRSQHYNTCLSETNVSDDDMLTIQDVINDKRKSANQEKIKKNGCVMQCLLQKEGKMEGSQYDIEIVEKILSVFPKERNADTKMFEVLNNCINETKNLPEKCEKSFALAECFLKAEEKFVPSSGNQEEHEPEHKSEK